MPTDEEIREYAHRLYVQSGWLPGRDLDNWLEAEATLTARARERMHGRRRARTGGHRVSAAGVCPVAS